MCGCERVPNKRESSHLSLMGAASAALRSLDQFVVDELNRNIKLPIYHSILISSLLRGHELWVMKKREKDDGYGGAAAPMH